MDVNITYKKFTQLDLFLVSTEDIGSTKDVFADRSIGLASYYFLIKTILNVEVAKTQRSHKKRIDFKELENEAARKTMRDLVSDFLFDLSIFGCLDAYDLFTNMIP